MNRSRILISIAACFVAVMVIASGNMSHLPKANTRDAIVTYVQGAAKIVQKSGPSCDVFASKDWRSADYYIFVLGPDERLLCHANADLIGKLQSEIANSRGDKVGEWILKAGAGEGKGWVDYVWPRPGQTTDVEKSSYVMGIKGPGGKHYIVGAGGYDLKK